MWEEVKRRRWNFWGFLKKGLKFQVTLKKNIFLKKFSSWIFFLNFIFLTLRPCLNIKIIPFLAAIKMHAKILHFSSQDTPTKFLHNKMHRKCVALNSHLEFILATNGKRSYARPIAVKLAHSGTNKSSRQHADEDTHFLNSRHPVIISNYPINKFYSFLNRVNEVLCARGLSDTLAHFWDISSDLWAWKWWRCIFLLKIIFL